MSQTASDFEVLLERLRDSGARQGETSQLFAEALFRKNRENAFRLLRTPYSQRAVFVPQCLRVTSACQAEERGNEYICKMCGACKIAGIARLAAQLGYISVKILKGGSALSKYVAEARPGAVLGVSCSMEGLLGILACERAGVPAFCVPLLRAGCADTDVDLDDVRSALEAILP